MGEIKITIENCNNISHGELTLEENKLNIKYGMNGTGKSSLSTAISLISQGKDLTELKPFGSGDEVVPTINLSSVCSLSNLFFRFHTTTLTEACSNELKQHHL